MTSFRQALDHVVVVIFENRSFDNVLGRLYTPEEKPGFEGVLGKDLRNPAPGWAEHPAPNGWVVYGEADNMDTPNPDPGEEYPHTNTQLYNVLDDHNRGKDAEEMEPPYNAPPPGTVPSMDGFVTDYISTLTYELGRQPTYDEYKQIMTGYRPDQVPVLNGLARGFGVFDHWFCEVPSQTLPNRSFWTAATSSGLTVNRKLTNFMRHNDAETIFNRLEAHGRSWKVYVLEAVPVSLTGMIHMPRLWEHFATHFVPYSEFERDCAAGTLPDLSLIEPNLMVGHADYHPAFGRALWSGVEVPVDPPSSILAGEAFLARLYHALRSAPTAGSGSTVYNTSFLIGWDEPGGTYDHVAPPAADAPNPGAPPGQLGFRFDRSGYRVPAVLVSPWVEPGSLWTEEYRHTSLIATLRSVWDLGDPFTRRDAAARSLEGLFSRTEPRPPDEWPTVNPLPVPAFQMAHVSAGHALGGLGRQLCHALFEHEHEHRAVLEDGAPASNLPEVSPALALDIAGRIGRSLFPRLAAA
ncbi:MAG TPA: alkaline phosphatase family protein, partial [Acidimicrobiales bacterium]|nr:alkaline phosphatase family protein [Acidimicrobiales bacterium]